MRASLSSKLGLEIDKKPLTYTNIRRKLYFYANSGFGFEGGFTSEAKTFNWSTDELIPILEAVLLDTEAYLWWLEQLALVTNGHYTAPMEISEELAHRILEEGLKCLVDDPEALRHLATSPGQLQMFWRINESDTAAWVEPKVQIGEELLGIVEETVTLPNEAQSNRKGVFDPSTATAANADDGDQAADVDDEKPTSTASNAPPIIFLDFSAVDPLPTMLDADDDLPRVPEELENDGEEEDEEPSK